MEKAIKKLLSWYEKNARKLPWRETKNPYCIWVSEIMLQQTRVEAVKPYYDRFLKELPTVESLALCPEDKLLKLWEGLGYYRRVKNMKLAAIDIQEHWKGEFPKTFEGLKSLPGVGNYTAAAIASFAFNLEVPAVDGNVLRVYERITGYDQDILKESTKKEVFKRLQPLIPVGKGNMFNQAMMELGAMVCVPTGAPKCEVCPCEKYCYAKKNHCIEKLPVKAKKKERRIEERTILLIMDGSSVLLEKRKDKGLLSGMYEFINIEGYKSSMEVKKYVEEKGMEPLYIEKLQSDKHIFSHVEWRMKAYLVKVAQIEETKDFLMVEPLEIEKKYPIPTAYKKYAEGLNIIIGNKMMK